MAIDTRNLTIADISRGYREGSFTAKDVLSAYSDAIKERNQEINAYLEVFDTGENDQPNGKEALAGVPIALKDNILVKGKVASASSKMLSEYVAPYSSSITKKLEDAGAIFLGRTNMDEFAMGSSTENSAFGPSKNPFDVTRVPGGSSGGSAAAVAAGLAPAALGSDTGGSIRQPASLCGLVGLKPTYGAVSRYGLIAMGSSLDQIGPLTKTVEDAKLLFEIIRGKDPLDSTTLSDDVWDVRQKDQKKKLSIGVPRHLIERDGIDEDVLSHFNLTLEKLEEAGHKIVEIELPHAHYSLAVYYILMPAEVSSNLARLDGIRYGLRVEGEDLLDTYFKSRAAGFGPETRRRIILGTYVLSAGYADEFYYKALALRRVITQEFKDIFKKVDVVATPTTPTPAFKIGEKASDPLAMYLEDVFTVPANIAGVPAISVPNGFVVRDGVSLPVGFQLQAVHTREDLLFALGLEIENHRMF